MVSLKTSVMMKVFTLGLILWLCFAIYNNAKSLDCDKCVVTFENIKRATLINSNSSFDSWTLGMQNLSNSLENDVCLIKWSKSEGYYVAG